MKWKGFRSMGAAFLNTRSKTHTNELFPRMLRLILMRFHWVSSTLYKSRWVRHYTPETKQPSKQLCERENENDSASRKSYGYRFLELLWCNVHRLRGHIHCWTYLKGAIQTTSSEKKRKYSFVCTHPHVVAANFHDQRFEALPHAPYSPDLLPSNYFLFPNLNKLLPGRIFIWNNEVKAEITAYFVKLAKSHYTEVIKRLDSRWSKWIALDGDYVEN